MAEPEISRRCHFCGASLRVRGMYCQQCGNLTTDSPSDTHRLERSPETEEVMSAPETVSVDLSTLPTAELANGYSADASDTVPLQPQTNDPHVPLWDSHAKTAPITSSSASRQSATTPLAGASAARTVIEERLEDAKKGLEKVREISTVMLDEASYDPSARFVLVAAVLFVLFLIILIMSEMMR